MSFHPWQEIEITFTSASSVANPYIEIEFHAEFVHTQSGTTIRRLGFWDGENCWKIRFASPGLIGEWRWQTVANIVDDGLHGKTGSLVVESYPNTPDNLFMRHGFWRMSPGKRSLVHADGKASLIVADTVWGYHGVPLKISVLFMRKIAMKKALTKP